jgi:alpha-maltose-1-phosphate synthase
MMMKALLLTNEYPPSTYGGAGVHVDYLSRELAEIMDVDVRAFGDQRLDDPHLRVRGFGVDTSTFGCPKNLISVFGAVRRCTDFNSAGIDADIVHCHTWYSHFGGVLAKLNYAIPLVITIHSLEPLRPWKREQLGHGYDFSRWIEKTAIEMADAVIAVSEGTKADVLRLFNVDQERVHIIYNGIDPEEYRPVTERDALIQYGIDPEKPFVLFVGRIARQKGIIHLVRAIRYFAPGFQVVLCAGAPDTPEIALEMQQAVAEAQRSRAGVIWIEQMAAKRSIYQLYSHAAVFCCPSIYEPFGIINLEAMACETAVVASAVGGIKEVVVDGETGFLVPLQQMGESPFEPMDPDQFARDLAEKINILITDPELRQKFGKAGRRRAIEKFSWQAIAAQTKSLYQELGA